MHGRGLKEHPFFQYRKINKECKFERTMTEIQMDSIGSEQLNLCKRTNKKTYSSSDFRSLAGEELGIDIHEEEIFEQTKQNSMILISPPANLL